MKIYNYNKETKEFTTSTNATENPLEKGKYLIPANATIKESLLPKDGFAVCFNEEKKEWEYQEDNRIKTAYDTTTKQEIKISYLGALKEGFTFYKPKETDKWDGTKWVTDKELLRTKTLTDIQTTYQSESTEPVSYKEVLYKGGDASASAIAGAVQLAQSLQETEVKIIDADDKPHIMTFDEALELSGLIAKAWRTAFFRYKELKLQISNAATTQELDKIQY
jgi:hypothetical protein